MSWIQRLKQDLRPVDVAPAALLGGEGLFLCRIDDKTVIGSFRCFEEHIWFTPFVEFMQIELSLSYGGFETNKCYMSNGIWTSYGYLRPSVISLAS